MRGYPSAPKPVDKRAASPCMAKARLSTGPAQSAGCGEPRKILEASAYSTRSVAVFDHVKPKTAASIRSIAEIGIDYMSAKPKTATHQETLLFLTTLSEVRLESLPKTASIVAEKGGHGCF